MNTLASCVDILSTGTCQSTRYVLVQYYTSTLVQIKFKNLDSMYQAYPVSCTLYGLVSQTRHVLVYFNWKNSISLAYVFLPLAIVKFHQNKNHMLGSNDMNMKLDTH